MKFKNRKFYFPNILIAVFFFITSFFLTGCKGNEPGTQGITTEKPDKEQIQTGTEINRNYSLSEKELEYISLGLVDIQILDPSIKVELKYSSPDNFLGRDIYGDLEKCFLQKEVAEKLVMAHQYLKQINPGYGFLIYDGLRPRSIQKIMWETVKGTDRQIYVANPETGSVHNYGCAVDLTIIDDKGIPLDMGTGFDFFGQLAQPKYEEYFYKQGKLALFQINNRKLLRTVMEKAGFKSISTEWWHFNGFSLDVIKSRYKIIE